MYKNMSGGNSGPSHDSPERILLGKKGSVEPEKKVQCKYGSECYRKNPAHFREFSHSDVTACRSVVQWLGELGTCTILSNGIRYVQSSAGVKGCVADVLSC